MPKSRLIFHFTQILMKKTPLKTLPLFKPQSFKFSELEWY